MKNGTVPDGIITVLNTPFTRDGKLDGGALARNAETALEAGVAGFLVPAMAAEVEKLSAAEREEMVRITVKAAAGSGAVVIGGASAPEQPQRVAFAEKLSRIGCDGILVSIPWRSEAHYEREYERTVTEIAERVPGFLMIQDWDFSGYGIPLHLIERLFGNIPNFRSLKVEVVPAGVKYSEVLRLTEGKLHVAGGWAVEQMIEGLDRGVNAFMPTGMHAVYVRIYDLYRRAAGSAAEKLFHEILPVLAFSNQHLDISIHFFKRLLYRQGIYSTPAVRAPILPFDSVHERHAEKLIERVIRLGERLEEDYPLPDGQA